MWMHPTSASSSTRIVVFFARAAYGFAMKWRALTPGTCPVAAFSLNWSPTCTRPGVIRPAVRVAANACRCARPVRCSKKARRPAKCTSIRNSSSTCRKCARRGMNKTMTLATVWLDGCSGCHMSILDMDERLLEILQQLDLVYSPLVDHKHFPDQVDITLVEG